MRTRICLVKRDYDLVYKAYSPKMARQLSDEMKKPTPIYDIAISEEDTEQYGRYARLMRRKQHEYSVEQQKFSEMIEDADIKSWLDGFVLHDEENEEDIMLNDLQKHDINLGTGKSGMLFCSGNRVAARHLPALPLVSTERSDKMHFAHLLSLPQSQSRTHGMSCSLILESDISW